MVCTKASLGTGFVCFEQNEHFWFQAWYRIDGSTRPFTLADLEGREVKESPGIRLMLFEGQELGVELKALEKPKYRQAANQRFTFPTDQWVQVTWHVLLHPDEGHVQVWQDEQLVLDGRGPTLPFKDMLYDSLEVGISAHSFGDQAATLFVDDVRITTEPLVEIRPWRHGCLLRRQGGGIVTSADKRLKPDYTPAELIAPQPEIRHSSSTGNTP